MCGVLYVRSTSAIPLERHLAAVKTLEPRGPDFTRYQHRGNVFVAQTVLRITGTGEYYQKTHDDFLSYNGEIYNYRWFGNFSSDTELVHRAVIQNSKQIQYFEGPWAFAWTDFNTVLYAADPQGERCLYHYQDDNILVVASEVTAILSYVNAQQVLTPYANKCWSMIGQTPWAGITRCQPGMLYQDGQPRRELDSVFRWISGPKDLSLDEAVSQFENIWQRVCTTMRPEQPATLSYSGGIDSQLISKYINGLEHLAIDIVGKDPIVESLSCHKVAVDPQQWAQQYRELIQATQMPAQTWSYVGKWLVAKHASNRIIFTGLAADELFGGYSVYQNIDYTINRSNSPYSIQDHDNLWQKCLDCYNGDPRPATLLMDYWYQVVGVDAPGLDRLGGHWGRETRNPFMHRSVIEFALNLPWHLRVGQYPKQLLRTVFERTIGIEIQSKQGFAGHANDSLPWLGVNITETGNRYQDWKQIAQQTFSNYTQNNSALATLDC